MLRLEQVTVAIEFYRKLGFREKGRIPFYYGSEDSLIMVKDNGIVKEMRSFFTPSSTLAELDDKADSRADSEAESKLKQNENDSEIWVDHKSGEEYRQGSNGLYSAVIDIDTEL